MKKRILAMLLTCCMVLSLLPIAAFAAGNVAKIGETEYATLQAAVDAVKNGETITLLDDCAENVTIKQAPDVVITLDGNGKTYSGTITVDGKSAAYATAGLTIQNVNFVAASSGVCINLGVSGDNNTRYTSNVTVTGCTFAGTDNSAVAIKNYTGGCKNLTVTNCTATKMHSLVQVKGIDGVTVTGCTVNGKNGISVGTSTNVQISNCTINATGYGVRADGSSAYTMTVSGGAITAEKPIIVRNTTGAFDLTVSDVALTASGANTYQVIFTNGDDDAALAEPTGAFSVAVAEGVKVYPTSDYVAKIGTKSYATLAEAIAAVKNGETIELLKDCGENVTIKQQKNLSFTIDGADKTYTGRITINGTGSASNQKQGLTIKNVNFDVQNSYAVYSYASNKADRYVRNVTVQNCTFTGGENSCGFYLRYAYNISVMDCEATNLADFFQSGGPLTNLKFENVKITDVNQGAWLYYPHGATFIDVTIEADTTGVWVRNNADPGYVTSFENCSIQAAKPFVLEEVGTKAYTLKIDDATALTSTDEAWAPVVSAPENFAFNVEATKLESASIGAGLWTVTQKPGDVHIVIYDANDLTTAVATAKLNCKIGDVIDLTKIDANEYYDGSQGYGIVYDGWFNDGKFNEYKAGKNPTAMETLTVTGKWQNIIAVSTELYPVVVKAVVDGDKENAETIFTGKALKGSNLIEYLEQQRDLGNLEKEGYTFDKWYNWDWFGHKFGDSTTVNGWTNVYVTYTANTDTPYKVQHLLLNGAGDKVYKAYATYSYKGTTDTQTNAKALTDIPGYTAVEPIEQLNINGDGSTVVKIYYARNDYTLTYDLAGGAFADGTEAVQTVQYLKKLTAPSDPVRAGYTFAGWDITIPEKMPANDLTITAQWTANTDTPYKVQHLLLNGAGDKVYKAYATYTQKGTTDTQTNAKALTNIPGYTAVEPIEQLNINGDGSTMVKIYYARNDYTLTYDLNGGKFEDSTATVQTVQYMKKLNAPDPVRAGYTFTGWEPAAPERMPANDLTLVAQWEANTNTKYKVQHLLLNGAGDKVYKAHATYTFTGTTDTLTKAVALTNIPGYTAQAFEQMNINGDGSTMVKIYYERNYYTLTYDLKGGEFEDGTEAEQTVQYMKKLAAPSDPVRAGYTFAGWAPEIPETMPAGNLVLEAQWEPNTGTKYKVQHLLLNAAGDKVYKAHATYTFSGTTDTLTNAVALTNIPGYTALPFEQMNINGDGSTMVKIYYERNYYTLAYELNGGEFADDTAAEQTVQFYKKLAAPADPVKTGYTFAGWAPEIPERMPANDLTLEAQWIANQYTVEFYGNGGALENGKDKSTSTFTYDVEGKLKNNPFTREGYTFLGWATTADATAAEYEGGQKVVNLTAENGGKITLYAVWQINDYKVTFVTVPAEANVVVTMNEAVAPTEGKTYTLPYGSEYSYTVSMDGYQTKTGTFTVGAEDMTVNVELERNEYTVTFDAKGGDAVPPQIVKHGDTVAQPTTSKSGYYLKGWYLDGVKYDFNTPVTQDITLTAQWKKPASVTVLHNCPSEKFIDVDQSLWYHEGIDYAIEKGLMNGVSDTRFNPDGTTNRAMIVTILYRLEGEPAVSGSANFSDVPADQWYTAAVNWAAANKIVNGFGDGTFGPLKSITREQVAAIFERYAEFKGLDTDATANIADFICSDWAKENVTWAESIGLFDIGTEVSDLTQYASRAEIACFFKVFHPLFNK